MDNLPHVDQLKRQKIKDMANNILSSLMKREFWIIALAIALSGCILQKQIILSEPTRDELPKLAEGTDQKRKTPQKLAKLHPVVRPKPARMRAVDDMMRRVDIQSSKGQTTKNASPIVRNCLSFLVEKFGPPIYKGKVTLLITDNPADNGKMVWKDSSKRLRKIILNDFNLHPTQQHVLTHELFHAFYQSRQFIKVNPHFITEGLAVYAEYKYRYRRKNNKQILEILREQTKSINAFDNKQGIDFNRPFQSYGQGTIDYMYFLSGRLFFSQNPKTIDKKIRKILTHPHRTHEKLPFDILTRKYSLSRNEDFLKRPSQETLALPEPRRVVAATAKSSGKEVVQRFSRTKKLFRSDKKFYVQVGSVKRAESAEEMLKPLKKRGYPVRYKKLGSKFS